MLKVQDLITLLQAADPNQPVVIELADMAGVFHPSNSTYVSLEGVFVVSAVDQQVDG